MSSAQITLIDEEGGTSVEVRLSDMNAESPAVIMATYLEQNWDVVAEACRRHLILRQAALDKSDASPIRAPNPKILGADGRVISSNE